MKTAKRGHKNPKQLCLLRIFKGRIINYMRFRSLGPGTLSYPFSEFNVAKSITCMASVLIIIISIYCFQNLISEDGCKDETFFQNSK